MATKKKPILTQEYVLAEPKAYGTYSAAAPPPAPPLPKVGVKNLTGFVAAEEKPAAKKRAIWIVHGMGQQIPFETLDNLTTGILRVAGPAAAPPRVRAVKIGDQVLQRVELDVLGPDHSLYELHLYEAYWAPKTEGVAKLSDVVSFLLDGGLRGILNSMKEFGRAMFGGMSRFRIPRRAPFEIGLTLFVLLALAVINGVIVAAAAAHTKLISWDGMLVGNHWEQLTALASCMSAVALTFGTILCMAEISKPEARSARRKNAICWLSWIGLGITTLAILASAGLMGAVTRCKWVVTLLAKMPERQLQGCATVLILCCAAIVGLTMLMRAWLRSSGVALRGNVFFGFLFGLSFVVHLGSIVGPLTVALRDGNLPGWILAVLNYLGSPLWVWPFLITLSAQIRTLMLQYVGDVAIYITPNKLDRFDQIRKSIKELARVSASALYQALAADNKDFEYQKIAIIGHSLGSVIAYDTLNKLITDDTLSGSPLRVVERTCVLETFGSPLDKIAFFFTIKGKDNLRVREQLASVVQPLIQSYPDFRTFPWINVYSPNDIISGELKFYDLLGEPVPPAVDNVPDDEAVVPLVAHVDYWKNRVVWQRLYEQVTR